MKIQKLKNEIKFNGFTYKLIKRTDSKCIYAQVKNGRIRNYEIFITKLRDLEKLRKKLNTFLKNKMEKYDFTHKEIFPNNEEFGARAWTYKNLDDAMKRYNSL